MMVEHTSEAVFAVGTGGQGSVMTVRSITATCVQMFLTQVLRTA
jgi:hypothetical protein